MFNIPIVILTHDTQFVNKISIFLFYSKKLRAILFNITMFFSGYAKTARNHIRNRAADALTIMYKCGCVLFKLKLNNLII